MKLLINPGNAGWIPPPEIDLSNRKPPHNHATVAETVSSRKFRSTENNRNSVYVNRDKSQSWNHARRVRFGQGRKTLLQMNHELLKTESTVLEEPYEDLQTVFQPRDLREQAGAGGDVAPDQDRSSISESFDDKNDLKLDYFFRKDVDLQLYNIKGIFKKE